MQALSTHLLDTQSAHLEQMALINQKHADEIKLLTQEFEAKLRDLNYLIDDKD